MKKNLLILFLTGFIFTNLKSQSYYFGAQTTFAVCGSTNTCSIDISGLTPGTTYTIQVTLDILLGNPQLQQILPLGPPYLECIPLGNSSTISPVNPSIIVGGSITSASFTLNNATTNTYDLTFTCTGTGGSITYSINLDCSLVPTLQQFYSQFYLQQIWTQNGNQLSNQPPISNVIYPYLSDPPANTLIFPGNYNQISNLVFQYQNIGTAPAEIEFSFSDLYSCATPFYLPINTNPIQYQKGSVIVANNWLNYSPNTSVTVNTNEFLFVQYSVDILGCNSNNTCQNNQQVQLTWRCKGATADNCDACDHQYISTFSFQTEPPTFEVRRNEPLPLGPLNPAFYDKSCTGKDLHWKFEIHNTTSFTTFPSINLTMTSPLSLDIIKPGTISISCAACTPPPPFITPGNVLATPCDVNGTLDGFLVTINGLPPQQSAFLEFDTYRCCVNDNNSSLYNLFDIPKIFNQWTITSEAIDICGFPHDPTPLGADDAVVNTTTGGISSHSPGPDMDLITDFHQFQVDATVCAGQTCACNTSFNCGDMIPFQVRLDGLFDNDPLYHDQQILGFNTNNQTVSGILRAKIHCDAGLFIEQANDVFFQYNNGASDWLQIPGTAYPFASPITCSCEDNDYFFYFNLSGLPTLTAFENAFHGGLFHFGLKPCCGAHNKNPSTFLVSFSLLPDPDGCSSFSASGNNPTTQPNCTINTGKGNCTECTWIPLSNADGFINVHCCGCITPGPIVEHYTMLRKTFGKEDVNNTRQSGGVDITPATTYFYDDDFLANRYSSVHGDLLQDQLVARVQEGNDDPIDLDPSLLGVSPDYLTTCTDDQYQSVNQGYTYHDDMVSNGMQFFNLQLRRKIPKSGISEMNLEILSFDFYIDDPAANCINASTCCVDKGLFTETNAQTAYAITTNFPTVFHLTVPDATDFPLLVERVDDEYLYTFKLSDIAHGSLDQSNFSSSTFSYPNDYTGAPNYYFHEFNPLQRYRLIVNYRVCGNKYSAAPVAQLKDLTYESSIENEMWLIGDNALNLSNHGNFPKAPSDIRELSKCVWNTHGFYFPQFISPGFPDPPQCITGACTSLVPVTQSDFTNNFKFYCETHGGIHTFYSSDLTTSAAYSSGSSCHPNVEIKAINTIVRNISDVFEHEFKTPSYFPNTYIFNNPYMPTYYDLNTNATIAVHPGVPFQNDPVIGLNFDPTAYLTGSQISINAAQFNSLVNNLLTSLPACTSNNFECRGSSIPTCPTIYDQFSNIGVNLRFDRKDCTTKIAGINGYVNFDASDAQAGFVEADGLGCNGNYDVSGCVNQCNPCMVNNIGINAWYEPNANLAVTFTPPVVTAASGTVCWTFALTTSSVMPTPPIETSAENVYLQVPVFPSLLGSWSLAYTVNGGGSNTASFNIPPGNIQIFQIDNPNPIGNNSTINGTLCGQFNCSNMNEATIPFDAIFGYGCRQYTGIPLQSPVPQPQCSEITSHLELDKATVNVVVDNATSYIPPDFTLCAQETLKVCFKSMDAGEVQPQNLDLTYNPAQISIISVKLQNCSNTLSTVPLGFTTNLNTNNYTWTVTDLNDIGITGIDPYMKYLDCICFEIIYETNCMFDSYLDLPLLKLNCLTYCGESYTAKAEFGKILRDGSNPSNCNDCYQLTKTATPNPVPQGYPLIYTITVTSYNAGTVTSTVILDDLIPSHFNPNISWPFQANMTFPINTPFLTPQDITVDGAFDCGASPVPYIATNTVDLSVLGSTATQTASVDVTVVSDCACNTGYYKIGYDQTSVTLLTDADPNPQWLTVLNGIDWHSDITVNGTLIINTNNANIPVPPGLPIYTLANKHFHMNPGSQIITQTGWNLVTSQCIFEACDNIMWQGIEISDGNSLQSMGTTIQDAEYGIKCDPNSIIVLRGCTFPDNFVSIYLPSATCWPPPPCYNGVSLSMDGCNFIGNNNMVAFTYPGQTYQGLPTVLGSIPFAGIYAGKSVLNLSPPNPNNTNYFTNLSNGIIGYGADFTIRRCKFEAIQPDVNYNSYTPTLMTINNFNGSAIYNSWASKSNPHIDQMGFGTSSLNASFNGCKFGIYAEACNVSSYQNKMENMNTGLRVTNGSWKRISLEHNNIQSNQSGMELFLNDGSLETTVRHNSIDFGNPISIIPAFGIRVEEIGLPNLHSTIHDNAITHTLNAINAHTSILVEGANGFQVTVNVITMNNNTLDINGIDLDGGINNLVSCNTISCAIIDGSSNQDQAAIKVNLGTDHEISCNHLYDTWNGILVKGWLMGTNPVIKTNDLHVHKYAFHIGLSSGISAPQSYMGNLWFYPAYSGGLNAWHQGLPVQYNIENPPPLNHSPYSQIPPFWYFAVTGQNDQKCNQTSDCNFGTVSLNLNSPMDHIIAHDGIENDPYTEETKWMLKDELYSRADENPSMLNDTIISQFYDSMSNTNTAALKDVDDSKKEIGTIDSNLVNYLTFNDSLRNTYLDSTNQILSQSIDALLLNDSTYLLNQLSNINSLTSTMVQLKSNSDSVISTIETNQKVNALDARQVNDNITANVEIESNEQIVNDIYLRTIAVKNFEFNAQQVNDIFTVASQCPLSGGMSVFKARAIYALIDNSVKFNDTELCNRVGISYKQSSSEKTSVGFEIYPNPADESITVRYKGGVPCNMNVIIYNVYGVRVYQNKFSANEIEKKIYTQNFSPGAYYIKLSCDENVLIDKLIIIH